jgi:indole-3-glycerol phosphate synthase
MRRHTDAATKACRKNCPPDNLTFPFEQALATPGLSVIAEVKKASPSKGVIVEDFRPLDIAREYETTGASVISVLTEPNFFQGSPEYLREIAQTVSIPVLRKDFIIDSYQIHEAKVLGASAILLICALLDDSELVSFLTLAHALGLSALVEAHDTHEVERAVASGARIIGVNNRDLTTFEIDLTTSQRLRALVPPEVLFVSESGIKTAEDAAALAGFGVDAVLIGEGLMRTPDKAGFIATLKNAQNNTLRSGPSVLFPS